MLKQALLAAVFAPLFCTQAAFADITSSLVFNYKLDGNALDSSVNEINGTFGGTYAVGVLQQAGQFFGANYLNYTYNPAKPVLDQNISTLSAWVKPSSFGAARTIISRTSGNWAISTKEMNANYALWLDGNGSAVMSIGDGNVSAHVVSLPIALNAWSHIVGTYDGNSTLRLYINAVEVNSTATALIPVTAGDLFLGVSNASYEDPFIGLIDDARLYSRALTASDVAQLYAYIDTNITINLSNVTADFNISRLAFYTSTKELNITASNTLVQGSNILFATIPNDQYGLLLDANIGTYLYNFTDAKFYPKSTIAAVDGNYSRDASAIPVLDLNISDSVWLPNLLQNPGAEEINVTAGWTINLNGGDGWYNGNDYVFAPRSGTTAFATSYDWDVMHQTLDLTTLGYSAAELDMSPTIRVGVWMYTRVNSYYFISARLLDANGAEITTPYAMGTQASPIFVPGGTNWFLQSHIFSAYPAGVRKVEFTIGGKDAIFWAGHYGTQFDDAFVYVSHVPIPVPTSNIPPYCHSSQYTTTQGMPLTQSLSQLCTDDLNQSALTYAITTASLSPSSAGELNITADGNFTFTPSPSFTGTVSFSYSAFDGNSYSLPSAINIVVIPATTSVTGGVAAQKARVVAGTILTANAVEGQNVRLKLYAQAVSASCGVTKYWADFNDSTPVAFSTSSTIEHNFSTVGSYAVKFWAEDCNGSSSEYPYTQPITVNPASSIATQTYSLISGWNLIALPQYGYMYSDDLNATFNKTGITALFKYASTDSYSQPKWHIWVPNDNGSYLPYIDRFSQLYSREGVWVKSSQAVTLNIAMFDTSSQYPNPISDGNTGWRLLGADSNTTTLSSILTYTQAYGATGKCVAAAIAWKYNDLASSWEYLINTAYYPTMTASGTQTSDVNLNIYKHGVWVLLPSNGVATNCMGW